MTVSRPELPPSVSASPGPKPLSLSPVEGSPFVAPERPLLGLLLLGLFCLGDHQAPDEAAELAGNGGDSDL
jgi:hypothetical protein